MMRSNKLPRLRYIWHHIAGLLNGAAQSQLPAGKYASTAPAFHSGITHKIPEGNTLAPWQVFRNSPGPGGRSRLVLFLCGDDEATVERMFARPATTASTPGAWMNGILVVTTNIWFNFLASSAGNYPPAAGGGSSPDTATQFAVMQAFHQTLFDTRMRAQQRFFIDGPGLKAPRVAILFQPRMEFGPQPNALSGFVPPNATESNADVVVDAVYQPGPPVTAIPPPGIWPPPSGKPRLQIGSTNASGLAVLRFALNIPVNLAAPDQTAIRDAELTPLATALATMLGDPAGSTARRVKPL
jgi:hypothetical protein